MRPVLTYPLFISEVLADPPDGWIGDANQDGRRDPHQDEFIELYNAGSTAVDIGGWRLGDAGPLSGYFRFPRKAAIDPRSYVVLFGGGNPSGVHRPGLYRRRNHRRWPDQQRRIYPPNQRPRR